MKLLLAFVTAVLLSAQVPTTATLTVTGPAVAKATTSVTLTVTLTGGGGPAGIQWDMTGLPVGASIATAVVGKMATCTTTRCLVTAATPVTAADAVTPIPDGPVATIAYMQPAAPAPLTVLATMAATPAGAAEALAAPPAAINVPLQSNCDVNGDGRVDSTDIGLILQQALAAGAAGTPTVLDVIRVIIAANGGACLR